MAGRRLGWRALALVATLAVVVVFAGFPVLVTDPDAAPKKS